MYPAFLDAIGLPPPTTTALIALNGLRPRARFTTYAAETCIVQPVIGQGFVTYAHPDLVRSPVRQWADFHTTGMNFVYANLAHFIALR